MPSWGWPSTRPRWPPARRRPRSCATARRSCWNREFGIAERPRRETRQVLPCRGGTMEEARMRDVTHSTQPMAMPREDVAVADRPATGRPTVVIVGAGFGGGGAARAPQRAPGGGGVPRPPKPSPFPPPLYHVAHPG